MAVITQRPSGNWQAKVRRDGWPSQSKTFRTKAMAEQWARSTETSMDRGSFVSTSAAERTLFREVAERYAQEYAQHHYRGKGWRFKLDRLVERLGDYSVAALTSDRVAWYRDERLADPDPRYKDSKTAPRVSGPTVKTELDLLSKVLDVAWKEFQITLPNGNPVHGIRKPRDSKSRERRLSNTEFDSVLDQCSHSRNRWLRPAFDFSTFTAMRQAEQLALTWDLVDLDNCVAYLPTTKNGTPRAVPLSSKAVAILKDLPRSTDRRVFPQHKQTLYSAFKGACKRAGVSDFTWHDLRHEALSRLASRGDLSVLELGAISGHKTLRVLKVYVQMHAAELARKLG
ncbi:site-specific integrase [Hydrogenophaga sp.]|uniref:site-specific integrase n=1 Tax=Hydrogenophaga sp. TaxID=1904254 RepID=UPI002730FCC5|nr:site-specific integrase [Hydrogenophaga sp.]MDP2074341.1 site-specific integrase [Hydrogenophaga sp.]MDP3108165.1 site-specific integrase [Hydrogenophaga sp.]